MAGGEWEIPFLCYITYNQGASGLLFIFSMIRCGVLPDSGKMYGAYLPYRLPPYRTSHSCFGGTDGHLFRAVGLCKPSIWLFVRSFA